MAVWAWTDVIALFLLLILGTIASIWLVRKMRLRFRRAAILRMILSVGLVVIVVLGFLWVAQTPLPKGHATTWVTLELCALGGLIIGLSIGFLFALPKVSDVVMPARAALGSAAGVATPTQPSTVGAPASSGFTSSGSASSSSGRPLMHANTNLEKVSDWLTTGITTLSIAALATIGAHMTNFALFVNQSLGVRTHEYDLLALGLALYFPPVGFLIGYIATRTVLAQAFEEAEAALEGFSPDQQAKVRLSRLIDIPRAPTPDQVSAAKDIVAVPLADLSEPDDQATWGRAQAILGHYDRAIAAFQIAVAQSPNDPQLLQDFAFALYQSGPAANAVDVITILKRSLALITDVGMKARVTSNIIVAYLYIPKPLGFTQAVTMADQLLTKGNGMPKSPLDYLYRACGHGQQYAYLKGSPSITLGDLTPLASKILQDAEIAIDDDPTLKDEFRKVADPNYVGDKDVGDDDLEVFAADNAYFRRLIGM